MVEKLEELLKMWDADSEIDRTEPGRALIDIPKLNAKYLRILSNHRLLSKEAEYRLIKMKKIRHQYYSGRLDEDTLKKWGWEPFEFILKAEISMYLEADEHIEKYKKILIVHNEIIDVCNAIIKELNNRTFELRTFVDWERFINGSN